MIAEVVKPEKAIAARHQIRAASHPVRLSEIEGDVQRRLTLSMDEFARVLGGGVVPGSLVLIGGDPGIGKSTLLLQTALAMAASGKVLYVSGEESERQMKSRITRIAPEDSLHEELFLVTETALDVIFDHIEALAPQLLIVDSIQTVYLPELDSSAGSISQVRECASRLQTLAKESDLAIFLVGHVTKEGAIAGPKVLEHIVDTVLYLEGDAFHAYRLLRSVKNRFGPTTEVGVFEMRSNGMVEVSNPSEAFIAQRVIHSPGSAIAVTMEGTRPLLVEVQGLTSHTSFGHPRRTANGIDFNRLLLTIAVLSRRAGVRLADQDVFVNVVGGLRINEPAIDLAVAMAIMSSVRDRPVPADLALIGEVGLSGELRAVAQMDVRINEAAKLGFKRVILPEHVSSDIVAPEGITLITVPTVGEAGKVVFGAKNKFEE
jgi:DNA repair protein RadA/Sms